MTAKSIAPRSSRVAGADSQFDLAVLGADDPLGGAVLQLLDEREVPVGRLFALTRREPDNTVVFRGQDWPCEAAEGFDFSQSQALLVCGRSPAMARLAREIRALHPAMPVLMVDDVAPAPAQAAAGVLKSIAALGRLVSADAFVFLPASYAGQDGVDELANQARGLFNMESPEPEVFPLQIAYNLVPYGSILDAPSYESVLAASTARIAGGVSAAFSVVWAPLFFGAAISLHARTLSALDAKALRNALERQDGITLMETELPAGTPTPATDAQGSEAVFVSRIQVEDTLVKLWLVFDPIQLEAARMVDVVENWIDKPASSMLT